MRAHGKALRVCFGVADKGGLAKKGMLDLCQSHEAEAVAAVKRRVANVSDLVGACLCS
jgi:hypothetical protein